MSVIPQDQAADLRLLMASRASEQKPSSSAEESPALTEGYMVREESLALADAGRDSRERGCEKGFSHQRFSRQREHRRDACATVQVERGARVVAIASGKGGVGKTSIAVNLAICLARRDLRVTLVDVDLGMANADVMLNVQPPCDLSHVVRGERTVEEAAVRIEPGLTLIAGASGLASIADLDPVERQGLLGQLSSVEDKSDVVILDCGAGISQNVLAFAHSADELFIVTTPEPTALTDAYAMIKVLSRAPQVPSISLIVNQAANMREGQVVSQRVASVANRFLGISLNIGGLVLQDAHVPQAVRQRTPFVIKYPACQASACVATLAKRVASLTFAGRARAGFFQRVVRFFY